MLKALPVRRWHARQWHIEMRTGSPSVTRLSCPQLQAAWRVVIPRSYEADVVSRAQARELALSLPEAVEQDHHGRPSFRVGGKIFATQWGAEHLNVMLDEGGIRTSISDAWTRRPSRIFCPTPGRYGRRDICSASRCDRAQRGRSSRLTPLFCA